MHQDGSKKNIMIKYVSQFNDQHEQYGMILFEPNMLVDQSLLVERQPGFLVN